MPDVQDLGYNSHNADGSPLPILLSVPHAGRDYPPGILENLRLPATSLLRLEDRYVDLLARNAVTQGVPTIIAHRARGWIDLNRDEDDVDVGMVRGLHPHGRKMPGPKQRGGLGLIPRRLYGEGEIWKYPVTLEDLQHRIASFHRPYHQHIGDILAKMRAQFGVAILLDLHSMPPVQPTPGNLAPQFVVGDRFGRSASNLYSEILLGRLRSYGFTAALNHPYAGDYILRRHGNIADNIHAIQIEVDRSLYLDAAMREPNGKIHELSALIANLVQDLAVAAGGDNVLMAAE